MGRRSNVVSSVTVTVALLLVGVTACGSDRKTSAASTTKASSSSEATSPTTSKATGSLTVFAAASLTESFTDEQKKLQASDPGLSIRYNFAGSGALVTQVQQGAPADVIATADTSSMKTLTDAGLVGPPTTFARNKLEILVEPGNPKGVKGLADLARRDLKVVLEDDSVPAGKYSGQALKTAGVAVAPVSKEPDVKSAVAKVTSGEADATIVYVSDLTAAGSKGEGVEIPAAQNVTAEYPIAVVKASRNQPGAAAYVEAIVRGSGQPALHGHGFLPAA